MNHHSRLCGQAPRLGLAAIVLILGSTLFVVSQEGVADAAAAYPTWSLQTTPNTSSSQDNDLYGVSCTGPSTCTSVGNFYNGTNDQTLIEAWNGTSWSIVPSSNTSSSQDNELRAVSCTGASACTAVGFFNNGTEYQTLIEAWNGTSWSVAPSPNTSSSQDNYLDGVSCTGPSACTAVGTFYNGSVSQTLIEAWNGTSWSIVPSPDTSSSQYNELDGVSCSGPSACTAVGFFFNGTQDQTLVEGWNGTVWAIVVSPSTSSSQLNYLEGVSCTGPSACTAVGFFSNGTQDQTLIEAWNGTSWSIVPSPNTPSSQDNDLSDVSCTGPSACTAVGAFYNGTEYQTLIETWNGTSWSIVPSPNTSSSHRNALDGVSCTGPSGCTTVGIYSNGTADQTLALSQLPVGYRLVASDGGIFSFGAPFYGSMGGKPLNEPIVGIAVDPLTGGYWEVASDGGIFAFNAPFYGSMGGMALNKPIVGIAADPQTGGYWEVASDGGIFAFNAPFLGSMGGKALNAPVVGISATPDGSGYREVASDGGLFSFGAPFYGSTGGMHLNKPVVGMATDLSTGGYWEVASDGGIFAFNAPFYGSTGAITLNKPVVGMAMDTATGGYWEVASDGGIFSFDAPFYGSTGAITLNKPVVGMG
jgi:hypothetical protein